MGFLEKFKDKFEKAQDKFKLERQAKAEKKARALEKKATYANQLNKRLKRQEKAQKKIDALKKTQQKRAAKKFKPAADFFSGIGQNMKKEPDFMSADEPFFMQSPKKKKKGDILDQFNF